MRKVLTIAGSDCSGGAGIQADLKTFAAHKVYGMSVITALTAQNTVGVNEIMEASPEFVGAQLDAIFQDIPPDAIKIGMVSNSAIIKVISEKLIEYHGKNIVVDPVMMASSGSKLLSDEAINSVISLLLPLATVTTPNLYEAEILSGQKIANKEDMEQVTKKLASDFFTNILVKGGHLVDCADDCLMAEGKMTWYTANRIDNPNTHGTGCTLSSAIACHLAGGKTLEHSIENAKLYLEGALSAQLNLGSGSGPLNHCWH